MYVGRLLCTKLHRCAKIKPSVATYVNENTGTQ